MQQVRTTTESVIHPTLSWSAIFAGWFVALGMAGLLTMGGLALGYSAFEAHDATSDATAIGTGVAAWIVLIWIGALFAGGMFASWFDGKDDNTMGAMHGITVWALFASTSGLMLAMGSGHPLHGAGMVSAARMQMADPAAMARLDSDTARARMMMAADHSVEPGRSIPGSNAAIDVRTVEDRAAHRMAAITGVMFLASLLGLLAAATGGWLGANHIHRVYHLRTYARSPSR